MQIKAVKTYQAVQFNKSLFSFFADDAQAFQNDDLKMELLKDVGAVSIKGIKDHILVPLTNVAYMIPMNETTKRKDTKSEPKLIATAGNIRD